MPEKKIVSINGRNYDARTGLPTNEQPTEKPRAHHTPHPMVASNGVHAGAQRSSTLNRRLTKKPAAAVARQQRANTGRSMDIARSKSISRFAPNAAKPAPTTTSTAKPTADDKPAAARPHPMAARVSAKLAKPISKPVSAKEIKEAAIDKAMAKTDVKPAKKRRSLFASRRARTATIITVCLAILVAGGYLAYVNLPSLSVSIAAAQAGIGATYPSYRPDGYSLEQPVTFSNGKVVLKFKSNGSSDYFTITQTRSSWDASAILQKQVEPAVGNNYLTTEEQGLTIYSYNNSAAWVNGGILYTIDGNAPLAGDQIRHIATSMQSS